VTSSSSQGACKTVLHELLIETLQLGIGDDDDTPANFHNLSVSIQTVIYFYPCLIRRYKFFPCYHNIIISKLKQIKQ
jgi:hypothetical protein